jgi:predicted RNA-binding protein with RPS1 domain
MTQEAKNIHQINDRVNVKITSIAPFGAFADLEGGGSGLIHISEIDNKFIKNIEDYLPVGSTHEVIITKALDKPDTYALSLKRAIQAAPVKRKRQQLSNKVKPLNRKQQNKQMLDSYSFKPLQDMITSSIEQEYIRLLGGK